MIIKLVDSRVRNIISQDIFENGENEACVIARPADSLEKTLQDIIDVSQGHRSIWLLRIISHGNSGGLSIGDGYINVDSAHQFSVLRDHFTPNGLGIALHSCGAASGTPITREPDAFETAVIHLSAGDSPIVFEGTDPTLREYRGSGIVIPGTHDADGWGNFFLLQLSRASNIIVRGGIDSQVAGEQFRFEGESVVVSPDGIAMRIPGRGARAYDTTPPCPAIRIRRRLLHVTSLINNELSSTISNTQFPLQLSRLEAHKVKLEEQLTLVSNSSSQTRLMNINITVLNAHNYLRQYSSNSVRQPSRSANTPRGGIQSEH